MANEKQAALDTVNDFLDSYSQRNIERCMSLISVSRSILLFGTNENEVFKTRDDVRSAFKRDFKSMTNIRWGEHRQFHAEALSTLTREGEQWKICSGMASVPSVAGTYSFSK